MDSRLARGGLDLGGMGSASPTGGGFFSVSRRDQLCGLRLLQGEAEAEAVHGVS